MTPFFSVENITAPTFSHRLLTERLSLGAALECVVIENVPVADWNDSDWPEVLEAAASLYGTRPV